jgi:porphobilinogen synthase
MAFPQTRMRRLRRTAGLRSLVREERLDPAGFVLPLFVAEGLSGPEPVEAMPGVSRHSVAGAVEEAREAAALGIGGVILFGIPSATPRAPAHGPPTGSSSRPCARSPPPARGWC